MTKTSSDGSDNTSHLPIQYQSSSKQFSFYKKQLILVIVLFIIEICLFYFDTNPFGFNGVVMGLVIFGIAVPYLLLGLIYAVQGHFKSALSMILIIPFLFILVLCAPYVSNNIKFAVHEKQYLEEIRLVQPDENGLRYKQFNWTVGSSGEGTLVIYDESDGFNLPEASRSEAWREKFGELGGVYACLSGADKVRSHFYIVHIFCG